MGRFEILRMLVLKLGEYDPEKVKSSDFIGKHLYVQRGKTRQKIGWVSNAFENPREGIIVDVALTGEFTAAFSKDGEILGVDFQPEI